MSSGSCVSLAELPDAGHRIMAGARRAVLGTTGTSAPHLVPVCWAQIDGELVTAIDHTPKSAARPARRANVEVHPAASMLFDIWDEDWTRLGWVMVRGIARIEPPGFGAQALIARYAQYESQPPRGDVIVLTPNRVIWWTYA
jgi:PPOX class probable F420-dependent enzyme